MGKDGWMFYKLKGEMEDSIADYQGTNHYSVDEMERFGALLKQAEENLASRGIKLVFYMVPQQGAGIQRVYALIREGGSGTVQGGFAVRISEREYGL